MKEMFNRLSVGGVLERAAELVPDKIGVIEEAQSLTYRELNDMANSFASSLSGLGFRKGDRVAIYMKNSVELMVSFYALQKLGVIVTWVNPHYRKAEAQFILKNSGSKGVIIFEEWEGYNYLNAVMALKPSLPDLEAVICVGKEKSNFVYSLNELLEHGHRTDVTFPAIDPKEDLAMLIYTSGTTGKPKGAMITHYGACRGAFQYSKGVLATSEDVFIAVLPMSHSYGCGAILIQPLLLKSRLVLMEKFEVEKAFQLIEKEKVTLQLAAPVHYILELNHPRRKKYDLSSLRAGLIAGQIAPEGLITQVEKEMGVYLTSFWGASEVGPGLGIICPYPSPLEIRENYIGKPIEDTRAKVADPATHEEVPDGEIGELAVSGWHVMKGYWNNPEETSKQIIDGWLYMGDLVSRQEGNYFKIYGRTKDLINRGGFKIYPHELESLLVEHPKVQEVCVVATPNPVLGESICACIIPRSGQSVSLGEIRSFLEEKLAAHKLPDELCVMKEFPRLSGGVKLNKFGKGGLAELAQNDESRERYRK